MKVKSSTTRTFENWYIVFKFISPLSVSTFFFCILCVIPSPLSNWDDCRSEFWTDDSKSVDHRVPGYEKPLKLNCLSQIGFEDTHKINYNEEHISNFVRGKYKKEVTLVIDQLKFKVTSLIESSHLKSHNAVKTHLQGHSMCRVDNIWRNIYQVLHINSN